MRVLLLCGVFATENEAEVIKNSKRTVEFSANVFQQKLISGLNCCVKELDVISAPFIGSYPNAYSKLTFNGFEVAQNKYRYVNFNNLWGFRNYSRACSLKKSLNEFISCEDDDKIIIVYSPHTPFVQAAAYAKKKDPRIKICLIVPDLPQYMNLNAKKSILYRVGKKYDIFKFNKSNALVDSYVLLTDAMRNKIDIHGCPYIVVEGIVDPNALRSCSRDIQTEEKQPRERYIVYTGKLNEKFGVKDLVDSFTALPYEDCRLILCGNGDVFEYAKEKAEADKRIVLLGQVTPDVAREWVAKADVLVNPRKNDEEYTKYSFPSKNIEYLASGNPVVAYMLDGMKPLYSEFLYSVDRNLEETLSYVLSRTKEELQNNRKSFREYAANCLSAEKVAKQIIDLNTRT